MKPGSSNRGMGWFLWALVALAAWGVWALTSKFLGDGVSADHAQALSTLGLLPILLFIRASPGSSSPGNEGRGRAIAFTAGLLGCLGNIVYYEALNRGGQASVVIPLTALYPLITVILAWLFLQEKLNRTQLAGAVLSLVAIYLFNVESEGNFWVRGMGFALLPIIFWGFAGFLQKLATNHLSGESATFWFLAAFIPVALFILLRHPLPGSLPGRIWLWSIAVGFFLGLGNLALLLSLARGGKASIVVPLTGLYPIVSVPIAILALGEKISGRQFVAIVLSLAAVAAISMESARPVPKN